MDCGRRIKATDQDSIGGLLTLVFYAVALAGIWLHGRREAKSELPAMDRKAEVRRVLTLLGVVLGLGLLLSGLRGAQALFAPIVMGFILWTPLGIVLMIIAIARGFREWRESKSKLRTRR